jgi:hypothetical protein
VHVLDKLFDSIGSKDEDEVQPYEVRFDPETGKPIWQNGDTGWIGYDVVVNGARQFHATSGAERAAGRRALRRQQEREQRKGQRAYNRKRRKQEFRDGTRRQQLRILRDEVEVTPAMKQNLVTAVENAQRANARLEREAPERERRRAESMQKRLDVLAAQGRTS